MTRVHGWLLAASSALFMVPAQAADWPQWMGPKRDAVWPETGILDRFPEGGPKVLWRVKIAGGFAGPAVADGRVYVHDFLTDADFRKVTSPSARPKIDGKERVLCLDARSGEQIWKHEYDCKYEISYPAGPRCTPAVSDGKVYTLGSEGHLFCLDAAKGKVLWSKDFKKEYDVTTPIWGFCGHPLIDGDRLICVVGGKGSVAVAFDKNNGKEIWKSLTAREPGYAPPTLITAGGKRQLLIWHVDALHSLDPESGKEYWSVACKPDFGMSIMAPRKDGNLLFAGGLGNKSVCVQLADDKPAARELWRGERDLGLSPINATPFVEDGVLYGVDVNGELRAIELKSGKRLWESLEPVGGKRVNSGTVFIVKNGDRFFLFSETGHLIIARLSPKGYEELSRCKVLDPTGVTFGRDVVWSHPAFAQRCMFARNDKEIVCVSLAREDDRK